MKIVERIKKGLIGMGAFLLTIPTKVFAVGIDIDRTPILYGMPEPNPEPESLILKNILNICRIAVIPLAFIIGIVIYLKKSKSSKKRKITTVAISICVAIVLYFIISYVINNVI